MKMLMEVKNEFWSAVDWSKDGKTLALIRTVSANESYPALFDVKSGRKTDLPLINKEKASYGPIAFSPEGAFIYYVNDAAGEFSHLYRFGNEGIVEPFVNLAPELKWDVNGLEVDDKSGQVAFSVNEDGASKVYVMANPVVTKEPLVPKPWNPQELKLPLGIVSHLEFSPDSKHLGFTL